VTDQPEIPNSVSTEMLDALLRNRNPLPVSTVIPCLDLGAEHGAPCDLQFAICQLIERSKTGTNIIQMLVAAMHLLTEVESHFDRHITYALQDDPPYDDLSPKEQAGIASFMRTHLVSLRTCLHQLDDLLSQVGYPYYQIRAQQLTDGVFKGVPTKLRDFRSHMLVSDETLDSLELSRDAVTDYLDYLSDSTDQQS
jgi:hypothetical protein